MNLPPLSLYVHIPWCVRKCPYCDFNSHAIPSSSKSYSSLPELDYIERLLLDLQDDLAWVRNRSICSIFIGGGTPSLFSGLAYQQLFAGLKQYLQLNHDCEITLEANPGTIEQARFEDYREAGINRLSIGIQSFNPQQLKTLGRIHDHNEAINAVSAARAAGFDNFNLDLMFALPGQSLDGAMSDLRQAIELEPKHLSWYQLTIEPNTEFYTKPPALPTDDNSAQIQEEGINLLASEGYSRYEISAYSQEGYEARHNLNYWTFGDYLGIGAGAHGKLTQPNGDILRTRKTKIPRDYLNPLKSPCTERLIVPSAELPLEFMMNALRLTKGFNLELFTKHTGLELKDIQPILQNLEARNLLAISYNHLQTTAKGSAFLNEVLMNFMD
jgi:putative oxygen-independent coproporphyrinogen III oxidase